MRDPIEGIHHVTAITGDAAANVTFYTGLLGLRLVAKSVNQDDPTVYHLFYGEERGRAGADLTFFEYPGAIPGRAGAGMVHRIVSRVASEAALDFWEARLAAAGVATERAAGGGLVFADPEGLAHELVVDESGDEPLTAEHPEIPEAMRIRGFEGVRAYSADPERSAAMVRDFLGGEQRADGAWVMRGAQRGGWIAFDEAPATPGRQSAGVVHHVAFHLTDQSYDDWTRALVRDGIANSGPVDRTYFKSLYFREPGGVLYELATEGPGFTVDLPEEEFGTKVILPERFEPLREQLEATLTPLPDPRAGWPARA